MREPWPGNVRELQHALRRAALFAEDGRIEAQHLRDVGTVGHEDRTAPRLDEALFHLPYHEAKERVESEFRRAYVQRLLERTGGNVMEAARRSGVSRGHLHTMIKGLPSSLPDGPADG